jgi:tRNA(adenine34) deaminase
VTAHAEMQTITAAANYLGGKILIGCTLYVTQSLSDVCRALYWVKFPKLFLAPDQNRGFEKMGTQLHPKTVGTMENEASDPMKRFLWRKGSEFLVICRVCAK